MKVGSENELCCACVRVAFPALPRTNCAVVVWQRIYSIEHACVTRAQSSDLAMPRRDFIRLSFSPGCCPKF